MDVFVLGFHMDGVASISVWASRFYCVSMVIEIDLSSTKSFAKYILLITKGLHNSMQMDESALILILSREVKGHVLWTD